jgi:Fic family protein
LALAHIRVQLWIDQEHASGKLPSPASRLFIEDVDRRFYSGLPDSFRFIRDRDQPEGPVTRVMAAGRIRGPGEEVSVGEHVPPSGGLAVARFLDRFESCYGSLDRMGPAQRLCSIAVAHHRLLSIHPFDDGNGRVARLITHAMFLRAGFGSSGLWSISRGLARGLRADVPDRPGFLRNFDAVAPAGQYRLLMAHADSQRLGDLDGRGNLSQGRLIEFVEWFLAVALDRVRFMAKHIALDRVADSLVRHYVPRRKLRWEAGGVLLELARLGSLRRSSVRTIAGVSARTATTLIRELLADGIVKSDGARGGTEAELHRGRHGNPRPRVVRRGSAARGPGMTVAGYANPSGTRWTPSASSGNATTRRAAATGSSP